MSIFCDFGVYKSTYFIFRELDDIKDKILIDNFYWRITKESVKDEHNIPPVVEDLVLLDFTGIFCLLFLFISLYLPLSITAVEQMAYDISPESGMDLSIVFI